MDDETVATPSGASLPSRFSASATPEEGRFLPGALVAGRYRIIALLGRGGMGEVYRATDLTLGQSVALKFLPQDMAINEHLLERFHNEVRVARQVTHANVCRVYDIGEADGHPFISMEYVDGEDLASLLARIGRLPADKALEITRKLCAGLAAAHERGIIHRDLKPHNIMLNRRGEVVIMDFGLAAIADELHGPEARNGTPAYMSPEQLRGDSVTAKSDLYSLGLIAYELFTGKRAFEAGTIADLIGLEERGKPPSLTTLISDVDPAVEKAILRCLAADPAQRPSGALAVAASLPGGDPLAAALAAGETPSPELVAASGKTEGFALRYAVPCLVFSLLFVLAYPFLTQRINLLAMAPMPFPPAVLEEKAREIAAAIGSPGAAADWKSWFWMDSDLVEYLRKRPGDKNWRQLFAAQSPVNFFYRQSPQYLKSSPDGEVTEQRPPQDVPGMFSMVLDSRGRLLNFEAVAPRQDQGGPAKQLDPAAAFRAAGLDPAQFHEVPPGYVPPLAFDARQAWTGPHPGLANAPVTVEIATWHGAATSFHIRWPWSKPFAVSGESYTLADAFGFLFFATLMFTMIFFARRNLRLGRGDRQGAARLAGAVFVIWLANRVMALHVIPSFILLGYFTVDCGLGLVIAGLLWLIYIAIEPSIRARWPHSLITWNRLLAGQVRDPRVGSHVLTGTVIGLLLAGLSLWASYWKMASGGAPSDDGSLAMLMGVRPILERLAGQVFNAVQTGFIIFFLLCGLRALVRRDWLAALVAAAILTPGNVQHSANLWVDAPLLLFVLTMFGLVLLRMGLVPAMVGIFVGNTTMSIPAAGDPSSWYSPVAAVLLILIGSIAVYGYVRSQAPAAPRSS